jgi:hypothetical protein
MQHVADLSQAACRGESATGRTEKTWSFASTLLEAPRRASPIFDEGRAPGRRRGEGGRPAASAGWQRGRSGRRVADELPRQFVGRRGRRATALMGVDGR